MVLVEKVRAQKQSQITVARFHGNSPLTSTWVFPVASLVIPSTHKAQKMRQ